MAHGFRYVACEANCPGEQLVLPGFEAPPLYAPGEEFLEEHWNVEPLEGVGVEPPEGGAARERDDDDLPF